MTSRLEIELTRCLMKTPGDAPCWVLILDGQYGHLCAELNHGIPAPIPRNAARVFAVLLKRPTANSFAISSGGQVEGFGPYCMAWQGRIAKFYKRGYRAVQFEYE